MPSIEKDIEDLGQPHLLAGINTLTAVQRAAFKEQLERYTPDLLRRQRTSFFSRNTPAFNSIEEITDVVKQSPHSAMPIKVGCLIVAGGQATRLKSSVPKGCTPVTLVRHKSLFQLFAEKIKAAGSSSPLAIMVSPLNSEASIAHFQEQDYFGLSQERVAFYHQKMLPFLDDQGNWHLERPGHISEGPDGNGGALAGFVEAGIWERWKQWGISTVLVIPVDNALADPCDGALCGLREQRGSDVAIKSVLRAHAQEQVGLIVRAQGKTRILEYSERGSLPWEPCQHINTGIYALDIDFVKAISKRSLPWHWAHKQGLWKCERFLFDILSEAKNVDVLLAPRELSYAPLKNQTGAGSLESVHKALLRADQLTYEALTGISPPSERLFELDPSFYYPTSELREAWKNRPLPLHASYISVD